MTARDYIEAIAAEFSRLRGPGLLLSPADAGLALSWHAAGVPLRDVQAELRRAGRLKPPAVRGAAEGGLSLQIGGGYWTEALAALRVVAGLDAEERREEKRSCVA